MLKFLTSVYNYELNVNRNIQKEFEVAESSLRNLNDYFDPVFILNLWIPIVGGCSHKLLLQLVMSLGFVNALVSVIKWCLPEQRPVWWIKENAGIYKNQFEDIQIDPYSCDTSPGFPSSYAAAFTAFLLIAVGRFVNTFLSSFNFVFFDKYLLIYVLASLLSAFLWFSRLYFLYEFLHQCLTGSLFAAGLVHVIEIYSSTLLNLGKLKSVLLIVGLGLIPITVYFAMLYIDVDPFWSVRMAFKWCADPLHLKHESTPVFTLFRDFGYLMGVALSCPLANSYENTANKYRKRLPILFVIEMINFVLRSYTPKQYGRFAFVAYEFLRNCLHSFTLLTVLPKFDTK